MTWRLPPDSLLSSKEEQPVPPDDLSKRLLAVLGRLGVPAEIARTVAGPTTVAWDLRPGPDVRMKDFTRDGRPDDIRYALSAETVRIQAPIPGEQLVGIEVPSPVRRVVALSELIGITKPPLTTGLGIASDLNPLALNIAKLPHLMVAGASGSGKSSLLHTIICSLLMRVTPDDLRMVLVDLKRTELGRYAGLPHLVRPPVDDTDRATVALSELAGEVKRREGLLAACGVQDVDSYNLCSRGDGEEPLVLRYPRSTRSSSLPRILCVVDEFSELMNSDRRGTNLRMEAVDTVAKLGRACGVHFVLATQSPHQKVFDGLIKANVPARIALRVTSGTHSRVALDQGGAEDLLGSGDALLQDGTGVNLQRFQSAFVPAEVIERIVAHWRPQRPPVVPRAKRPPVWHRRPPTREAPSPPPPAPAPRPRAARSRPRTRSESVPRRVPSVPRPRGRVLGPILVGVILFAVYVAARIAPNPGGCPGNSVYTPTSRMESCQTPSGHIVCVQSSYSFKPRPNGPKWETYVRVPAGGPWCSNAHG